MHRALVEAGHHWSSTIIWAKDLAGHRAKRLPPAVRANLVWGGEKAHHVPFLLSTANSQTFGRYLARR